MSNLFSLSNANGFDGASGGVIQFTKNFQTLGQMVGDENVFELEQRAGKVGMLPKKDTFLLFVKYDSSFMTHYDSFYYSGVTSSTEKT